MEMKIEHYDVFFFFCVLVLVSVDVMGGSWREGG